MDEYNQQRWDKAVAHAKEMLELYLEIPTVRIGAAMIQQCIGLYEKGDRSKTLLNELENIE